MDFYVIRGFQKPRMADELFGQPLQANKFHSPAMESQINIPITIVTGFPGAGKTSLINHHLQNDCYQCQAVLVNDFGAVKLDTDLVSPHGRDTPRTTAENSWEVTSIAFSSRFGSDLEEHLPQVENQIQIGAKGWFPKILVRCK